MRPRAIVLVIAACFAQGLWAQQSPNFVLGPSVLDAGGNPAQGAAMASPTYRLSVDCIAETAAGGTMTGSGYLLDSGFVMMVGRPEPACSITCEATGPPTGIVNQALTFQAEATATGCTGSPTFSWAFGDGATSTSQSPSHAYASAGTFGWTLAVAAEDQTCTRTGSIVIGAVTGKPGDCDGDGIISIGEVQRAINMFLGNQPPACGVDCSGEGEVGISELQKVINGFLGQYTSC